MNGEPRETRFQGFVQQTSDIDDHPSVKSQCCQTPAAPQVNLWTISFALTVTVQDCSFCVRTILQRWVICLPLHSCSRLMALHEGCSLQEHTQTPNFPAFSGRHAGPGPCLSLPYILTPISTPTPPTLSFSPGCCLFAKIPGCFGPSLSNYSPPPPNTHTHHPTLQVKSLLR